MNYLLNSICNFTQFCLQFYSILAAKLQKSLELSPLFLTFFIYLLKASNSQRTLSEGRFFCYTFYFVTMAASTRRKPTVVVGATVSMRVVTINCAQAIRLLSSHLTLG